MKLFMMIALLGASLTTGTAPAAAQAEHPISALPAANFAATPAPSYAGADTLASPYILRSGTPVVLRMAETLSTEESKLAVGYLAHLEVLEPVMVDGFIAIPAGSPAFAQITEVRNKGMWGKSGRIICQMMYVTVGSRKVRLRGVFDNKGQTGTAGVIAAIAVSPIIGFFVTGTSAKLAFGHSISAIVDDDVALAVTAPPNPLAP